MKKRNLIAVLMMTAALAAGCGAKAETTTAAPTQAETTKAETTQAETTQSETTPVSYTHLSPAENRSQSDICRNCHVL